MINEIEIIIKSSLVSIKPELLTNDLNLSTVLYGSHSVLDSLDLINLVVDVESRVNEKLGKNVLLVDDSVLSEENSPFETIGALSSYIVKLLNK